MKQEPSSKLPNFQCDSLQPLQANTTWYIEPHLSEHIDKRIRKVVALTFTSTKHGRSTYGSKKRPQGY